MRIALVCETFSPDMGYLVSMLPKYLARLGAEVHVLAVDLPPYHRAPENSARSIRFFREQTLSAGSERQIDGYTVHILPHGHLLKHVYMRGVVRKLREIAPDVVYSIAAIGWLPMQAALGKLRLGYRLFTGNHNAASTFHLTQGQASAGALLKCFVMRWLPGRLVSLLTTRCYVPTSDCGEIAWRFFGVQKRKVKLVYLGVDTDFFYPVETREAHAERVKLRAELGFAPEDIVCIYTGKLIESKNPLLLLQAVDVLCARGLPYRCLFIGDGVLAESLRAQGAPVMDFMPVRSVGQYYRAADIAVWPTNETTSMLDAAACGLPLIVSDRIYRDPIEGNGLTYRMNDLDSLVETLLRLQDVHARASLGAAGVEKMRRLFTWRLAAEIRMQDFQAALGSAPREMTGERGRL
jgi:glycosyltransferase involved in cell wall biosynthesis